MENPLKHGWRNLHLISPCLQRRPQKSRHSIPWNEVYTWFLGDFHGFSHIFPYFPIFFHIFPMKNIGFTGFSHIFSLETDPFSLPKKPPWGARCNEHSSDSSVGKLCRSTSNWEIGNFTWHQKWGNIRENHGKTMGKSWENHAKIMGKSTINGI